MAELLLNHKAEVNVKNPDGITPLHLAAQRGDVAVSRSSCLRTRRM